MGVIGLMMLFVRPPEDTVGVIGLIMLFVRPTRGHGGRYRVNNGIRTSEDTVGAIGLIMLCNV